MDKMNTSSPPVAQTHFARPGHSANASTPVVIQVPKSGHSYLDRDQIISMKATSTTQLICGLLAMIFEAMRLSASDSFAVGTWSGSFFVLAGILGLITAFHNNKCLLISTLVLSLLSSLMLFAIIGVKGYKINYWEALCYYNEKFYCRSVDYIIASFLIIISVVELIASIWASVLCCKAIHAAGARRSMCCTTYTGQGASCCYTEPAYYVWQPATGGHITSEPPIMAAANRQYPDPAAAPSATYQVLYPGASQPTAMSTTNYAAGSRGQNIDDA